MNKISKVTSGVLGAMLLGSGAAYGATSTGNMTISAEVTASCSVATNTLAFTVDPVAGGDTDAQANVDVTCTNNHPYTVDLGLGANADVSTRRMVHSTDATAFLTYELYSDSARTQIWTTGGASETGTGSVQSLPVYGRVPEQLTAKLGSYTDTVVVTVTY